jgi:hypothetical protein
MGSETPETVNLDPRSEIELSEDFSVATEPGVPEELMTTNGDGYVQGSKI